MHYLASLVDHTDPALLSFVEDVAKLDKAVSGGHTEVKADFDKINSQVRVFELSIFADSVWFCFQKCAFLEEKKYSIQVLYVFLKLSLYAHRAKDGL